jgi:D-sedoheptulose 7-phosphate isomerase
MESLANALLKAWREGRQVFIFGNGGSAANAMHLANDFVYGAAGRYGQGLKAIALSANSAVMTCLANDEGYDSIYARQLSVQAGPGDIAIALSGSGNSPNIVEALSWCRENGVHSFAILGFSGGKSLALADVPIHVRIDDMQVSEDLQMVVGHMMMRWLNDHRELVVPFQTVQTKAPQNPGRDPGGAEGATGGG